MDPTALAHDVEALGRQGLAVRDLMTRAREVIAQRVDFDSYCAAVIDPVSLLPTWVVRHARVPPALYGRWVTIEHTDAQHFNIADLPLRPRETTSLLSDETSGVPERSSRFREIFRSLDLRHEVRVFLRAGGLLWGGISLMREIGQPDFAPEEVRLISHISTSFAEALRRTMLQAPRPDFPLRDESPGVILLSADDRVISISESAERMLDELADVGEPDLERLPSVIRGVALRARHPLPGNPATSVSMRTPDGHWVTLRATTLDGGEHVAVVIERTRPEEAAGLILAAYGLSEREREIGQYVRSGLSTEDVSKALGISVYTVQDHFKSIFDKTGLSSRKELAARLYLASQT